MTTPVRNKLQIAIFLTATAFFLNGCAGSSIEIQSSESLLATPEWDTNSIYRKDKLDSVLINGTKVEVDAGNSSFIEQYEEGYPSRSRRPDSINAGERPFWILLNIHGVSQVSPDKIELAMPHNRINLKPKSVFEHDKDDICVPGFNISTGRYDSGNKPLNGEQTAVTGSICLVYLFDVPAPNPMETFAINLADGFFLNNAGANAATTIYMHPKRIIWYSSH